jgi:hypothetical protein
MDTTESYIRLNADGTTEFVKTTRNTRDISEEIARQFSSGVTISLKNAFEVKQGVASVIASATQKFCCVELERINLTAHFSLGQGNILTPRFFAPKDEVGQGLPKTTMVWHPPANMTLVFAVSMSQAETGNAKDWFSNGYQQAFLIAYDPIRRAYLLPLPNLYDDCAICMGEFNGRDYSMQTSFQKALEQFDHSAWNSDLLGYLAPKSQQLFQFEVSDTETNQTDWDSDHGAVIRATWPEMAEKVATPVTAMIGGLML